MNINEINKILERGIIDEIFTNLQNYHLAENCKIDFYMNDSLQFVAEICFIHPERFETYGHMDFCHEYKMNDNAEWKNFKRCVTRILKYVK